MTPAPDREKVARWNAILKPYWGPDTGASVRQLLTSAVPFVMLWYATLRSLEVSY
ncbi:MAG: fatty acid desaturase, partial [Gammaproteobacteria bacterium]|nr:fatty acid desaturase [Gammaproteobacteria bacterium]